MAITGANRYAQPLRALGNPEDVRATDPDAEFTSAVALWRGVLYEIQNITIPAPVGGSTEAKQTTGNASLASIDGKLTSGVAVTQSGTWNVTNISGTISLPTGAATSANQANVSAVATATLTTVDSAATSAVLKASNAARKGLAIFNTDANALYVKFGATASLTSFTVKVPADGYYEMPQPIYTGAIDGIWAADGAGSAFITEL